MNQYNDLTQLYMDYLFRYKYVDEYQIKQVYYKECDYKTGNEKPQVDDTWGVWSNEQKLYFCDRHFWVYCKVELPERMLGKNVWLKFFAYPAWEALGPQTIVYVNGEQQRTFDPNHTEIRLDSSVREQEIYLYIYSGKDLPNYFTGYCEPYPLKPDLRFVVIDEKTEKLYYHFKVLRDILLYTDENTEEYRFLATALEEAGKLLDFRQILSRSYHESIDRAIAYLDKEVYEKAWGENAPTVTCIGHTHIDIAWLWTIAQTREKAQRSFATVIELMKLYPDYRFTSSQPILYEMVKEEAPVLYEEIKARVQEGRWEVEGGMWVEADCNLTSGESLVRQILVGKRFFKDEFGADNKVLWLLDVFGYSAAMPQILKKSGIDYFVTSKIGWNDSTRFPYDMFYWKGIDGTEIFSYFLTGQEKKKGVTPETKTTYVGFGTAPYMAGTWERMQQKDFTDNVMLAYGFGDGGGGPQKEDVEQIGRMQKGLPNCPKAKFGKVLDFLRETEAKAAKKGNLPVWEKELYLELHRGTYTSQAKNKRNNRKCEFAYGHLESLRLLGRELVGQAYPKTRLDRAWKTLLTNQFHDIIPGSSIGEVYRNSDCDYAQLFATENELKNETLSLLTQGVQTDKTALVFNPHGRIWSGNASYDGKTYYFENVPAKGYKAFHLPKTSNRVRVDGKIMENDYYKIVFDEHYEIESLFDKKRCRELVQAGERCNRLRTYEDMTLKYDAWELDSTYKNKYWDIVSVENVTVKDDGAKKGVCIERKYLSCTLKQTVWLHENVARVDFETEIDWNVEHVLLKALFPLNVETDEITCDIQFGNVKRTTKPQTEWEKAKFEFCAQKYVDLSEENFGVALLNDCKYGHNAENGTIGLTLLKCATYPDHEADKGKHVFTYSLYAHDGKQDAASVVWQAYDLNAPLYAIPAQKAANGGLPEEYSLLSCDSENVIAETAKRAENNDDIVVRLFECLGKESEANLTLGFVAREAYITDLMENPTQRIELNGNRVSVCLHPFEIVTLRFVK